MGDLARIRFGDGFIGLQAGGNWIASTEELETLASMATAVSQPPFYEYSPAHGAYGGLLASMVHERLGGVLEVRRITGESKSADEAGIVF